LLIESLLLSFIAVALAVAFAAIGSRALVALLSGERSGAIVFDLTPNWHVLGFAAVLGVGTAIFFGLAPALRDTAVDLTPALKDGSTRTTDSRSRLVPGLVVLQVALSLLLLVGAGLFMRTLQNLRRLDIGFEREGVLLVDVDGRRAGYRGARLTRFYQDLLQEVQSIPGVSSVGLSRNTPLNGSRWWESVAVDDERPETAEASDLNAVSPEYFHTMQTPLVAGRDFTPQDDVNAPRVAIVDEAFVRRHFPDGQPLGRRLSGVSTPLRGMQVVGVVKNTASRSLREAPQPTVYVPYFQQEAATATFAIAAGNRLDPVATAVRNVVGPTVPESPVAIQTLAAQVESGLAQERLLATIAGGFGALALILAAVGLYGVLAYTVTRRMNEIGIRMALGGDRASILGLVMSDAARWLLCGIALGLPAAWMASRLIASLLFGVAPVDPLSIAIAMVVLIGSGLLAAVVPALRASRVEPIVALRHE
jgi:putative ABC transport system permease protein